MPAKIIIDGIPTNLSLPSGTRVQTVESDLYSICERLKEIDPNLQIVLLDPEQWDPYKKVHQRFAIMEKAKDGTLMLVCKVPALDGRIVQDIARMAKIPVAQRVAELERINAKIQAEDHENELEEMYERIGGQMRYDLHRCGFSHQPIPTSYRPLNRTARRAGRRIK